MKMPTASSAGVPQHIAVIMDGNGRWAQARGLPRLAGHKQGAEAVETMVRAAAEKGVRYLTLFAFSTENWNRPEEEVTGLMTLLRMYLRSKTAEMHKNNVRLKIIGDRSRLSDDIISMVDSAEALTAHNTGITVLIAISYSGRWDIAQATRALAAQVQAGTLNPHDITEDMLGMSLSTAGIPEPDLVIRTSGEKRVSNFLLWQCAYSEFYYTDTHWPDFSATHLDDAIASYQHRERRFGNVHIQAS